MVVVVAMQKKQTKLLRRHLAVIVGAVTLQCQQAVTV
jgi:hypothetical protein